MSRSRVFKFAVTAFLSASAGLGLAACKRSAGQANAPATASPTPNVVQVSSSAAITRQLPQYFEGTGSLAAHQQTDVAPETSGKVAAVGVDIGSSVRKGQMLVRLEDADFKDRIQQAQAQLDQARATLRQNEAKIGLRPGQKFVPEIVPEVAAAKPIPDATPTAPALSADCRPIPATACRSGSTMPYFAARRLRFTMLTATTAAPVATAGIKVVSRPGFRPRR
jgi:multidrug efflux pump subunit AcrA (membrane-fusion protein)